MAAPRRSATIVATIAVMRSEAGPPLEAYRVTLDLGALFRFVIGSALADDGWNVIVPVGGGTLGAWIRVRPDDRGADLTDANATITIGGKPWRVLPAATLSTNRTLTLSTAGALAGDEIEITRRDLTANTVAIVNGGIGAGTLVTLPVSVASRAVVHFDGTNWSLRASGLLL